MSRIDKATRDLFLQLGATPRIRSSRADTLFRRLRGDNRIDLAEAAIAARAANDSHRDAAPKPAE